MSGQIAKLFLRGSLVNVTAKNLDDNQKEEVDRLINTVWNDTRLDNAKHEFCQALSRTIGGEYTDKDFAMQEVWITLWRTAVDTLYHNQKPTVVRDSLIRKKHFQTCIFNYLRQILSENKIPQTTLEKEISGPAAIVAKEIIQFYIENSPGKKLNYTYDDDKNRFELETCLIPLKTFNKIGKLKEDLEEDNVIININQNSIDINVPDDGKYLNRRIKEKVRVDLKSFTTFNDDEDDSFQQHCEYKATQKRIEEMDQMTTTDAIITLKKRLPNNAKKVLEILIDQPKEFVDQFYPRRKKEVRPKEIHIAKWLGMSKSDVVEAIAMIRRQAIALDIGND